MIGAPGKRQAIPTIATPAGFFLGHHLRSLRARLALRSLDPRRHCVVLSAALKLRKERLLIGPHEVLDRPDAGDRDELGEWIDAEFSFQIGHEKCQVERAQAERCAELVSHRKACRPHRRALSGPHGSCHARWIRFLLASARSACDASIHHERLSGDEGGLIGSQEVNGIRDLTDSAPADPAACAGQCAASALRSYR